MVRIIFNGPDRSASSSKEKERKNVTSEAKKPPEKKEAKLKKWKLENNLVMSWLLNTMTNEIEENFMHFSTAQEIWDATKETYSSVDNTSAIFEIKSLTHDLRQGISFVIEHFNTLTHYWQQLDIYDEIRRSCIEDNKQYKPLVEKDRIYKFLLGLNKDLDEVQGRILGTKPLPKIHEVFSKVRREVSRRRLMLGNSSTTQVTEGSTLAVKGPCTNSQQKKSRPWCEHCKKLGHTKDTCWFLHGKLTDAKRS